MSNVDIICHGCGTRGSVGKVTASLVCGKCGHGDDLDLFAPRTAADQSDRSGGGNGSTGWGKPRPNVLEGWNDYAGPAVGQNPEADQHLDGDLDAYNDGDWSRGNPGYIPGGGYDNAPRHLGPTTGIPPIEQDDAHAGPQSGGARWNGKNSSRQLPLHVTLPDGTQWEGVGSVVASTPAKTRLDKMVKAIMSKNAVTKEEALTLARRAVEKFGNN